VRCGRSTRGCFDRRRSLPSSSSVSIYLNKKKKKKNIYMFCARGEMKNERPGPNWLPHTQKESKKKKGKKNSTSSLFWLAAACVRKWRAFLHSLARSLSLSRALHARKKERKTEIRRENTTRKRWRRRRERRNRPGAVEEVRVSRPSRNIP